MTKSEKILVAGGFITGLPLIQGYKAIEAAGKLNNIAKGEVGFMKAVGTYASILASTAKMAAIGMVI